MKTAFALFLLAFGQAALSQDSAKAFQFWYEGNLPFARQAVDEWTAGEGADRADCWLLKAKVYYALKAAKSDLVADPSFEAYVALKRACTKDIDYVKARLLQDGNTLPFSILKSYTNEAVAHYNAGIETKVKSLFETSLDKFQKAFLIASDFQQLGLLPVSLDTINVFYAVKAAAKAGKVPEALQYSKKLVTNGASEANGVSLEPAWQWLFKYYIKNNDEAGFNSLKEIYQQKFPYSTVSYYGAIEWYKGKKDNINALKAYVTAYNKFYSPVIYDAGIKYAKNVLAKPKSVSEMERAEAKKTVIILKGLHTK